MKWNYKLCPSWLSNARTRRAEMLIFRSYWVKFVTLSDVEPFKPFYFDYYILSLLANETSFFCSRCFTRQLITPRCSPDVRDEREAEFHDRSGPTDIDRYRIMGHVFGLVCSYDNFKTLKKFTRFL